MEEVRSLREAAGADWRDLEPAIFGTLFERALDEKERKRLGAFYTPRAYVERLVNATVMEPLRSDWVAAQSAAERALRSGSTSLAVREVQDFLRDLASVRVLDPAAGTGNFLYVALRQMKQLEGEVLKHLHDLGGNRAVAAVSDISVKPEQFFGMEVNRRAVEIAELVLWIGYLQWHLRTRDSEPAEPILGSSDHIQEKDAVLEWDGYPEHHPKRDRIGIATNAEIYPSPRQPEWPDADFIVGNPPFIGGKNLRGRLSDAKAEALWRSHKHINKSADYVMYWWDRAAELLTRKGTRLRRFGLVTTNSVTQIFQSRVIDRRLKGASPISLLMAIPDHPWTKATKEAASVRIAMTVAAAGTHEGILREVVSETAVDTDEPVIKFKDTAGTLNANLTVGTDSTKTNGLVANGALCYRGVQLMGSGFIVERSDAKSLGLGLRSGLEKYVREYRNGRDLTSRARGVLVVDLFGLTAGEVRARFPEIYQHLTDTVKLQRKTTHDKSPTRDAKEYLDRWWLFGKPRQELRPALAGVGRYIATVETTKHRVFQFLDSSIVPDNMLVVIASADAFHLGILSSRVHTTWSLQAGGWLGVGNDPRYSKSLCFDPFPFPDTNERIRERIRRLAEELDGVRKAVLSEYPDLTLTGLYNILEKIRDGVALSAADNDVKMRGRILIIKDLHDEIDNVVLQAYGWKSDFTAEEMIARLAALNAERSAEERGGFIRWLRPDYQIDRVGALVHRADRVQEISIGRGKADLPFPSERKAQAAEVLRLMRKTDRPLTPKDVALAFTQGEQVIEDVNDLLRSLARLGEASSYDNGRSYIITAA